MVINYSLRAQQLLHIVFNVGHGTQAEFLVQHGQQVRRQEAWRCRAGHDVGHAQREQSEQDDNRFLLKPGEHQGERQIVDAAAQFFRQGNGKNNGRVSIVTLARIDQARQTFDIAEVQLVETVFTARQGQDQAIVRYAGDEYNDVIDFTIILSNLFQQFKERFNLFSKLFWFSFIQDMRTIWYNLKLRF